MMLARANCPVDRHDDAMLIATRSPLTLRPRRRRRLVYALSGPARPELRLNGPPSIEPAGLCRTRQCQAWKCAERTTDELRIVPCTDGVGEELVLTLIF